MSIKAAVPVGVDTAAADDIVVVATVEDNVFGEGDDEQTDDERDESL
jgi:hypothetical protein